MTIFKKPLNMTGKTNTPHKTKWNLSQFYKGLNDPKIEKDVRAIERAYVDFEKKYRNKNFTKDPKSLAKALGDKEKITAKFSKIDPEFYLGRLLDTDSQNEKARALLTKIDDRLTEASNRLEFYHLRISNIPKAKQSKFLNAAVLKPYAHLLQNAFKVAKYNLSEKEEQIVSLLGQTSYSMWVDSQEKLLSKQMVKFAGKMIPISKAMGILPDLKKSERRDLHKEIIKTLESISHLAEAEINAIINFKKVMDKRRGFRKPYSATILSYENDEKEVEALVSLVTSKFSISHRFYKLHAKLIGEKKITSPDRSAPIGKINRKFDFSTTVQIVMNALGEVDSSYAKILDKYLRNGQIDAYPYKGKQSGGYCAKSGDLPTLVFLNHTNDLRSVETLGHEMGHAIHGELAKAQPHRYRGFSTATAEVASTFFEQVTQSIVENQLTEKERIVFLHNKIMGDIATIFRQIALFNFENELHEQIRMRGQLSGHEMASLLAKHMRSYLGPAVEVSDKDGYGFIPWSHIRYFFYVYSYAYGQIVSKALFEMWNKDKSASKKIEKFLKAGRSMSPKDIFKSIGIDVSNPKFFEAGLKSIEKDIDKLEKLTNNRRK